MIKKMNSRRKLTRRFWIYELVILIFFLVLIFNFEGVAKFAEPIIGMEKDAVEWAPLYELAFQYILVVVVSCASSFIIAFIIGNLVHLYKLDSIKELLLSIGSFGTTFPTISVIALLVPSLGYGFEPVIAALILYGIFPILMNTIQGLDYVDEDLVITAKGQGMSDFQRLVKLELPMAFPTIIAGVRISFIINIAAATVGAVVGAGGLGMPIVSGIRTDDPVLVLKGAVPVMLIALLADRLFSRLEKIQRWRIY